MTIFISILIFAGLIILAKIWVNYYNKFQYWYTRAKSQLANVVIVKQERYDNIMTLAKTVEKYDAHEYQVIKETIEARGEVETPMIQALSEKYPMLKADTLHTNLMERDSYLESRLCETRTGYNYSARRFNESVRRFPQNIIAGVHNFKELNYLAPSKQVRYQPDKLF